MSERSLLRSNFTHQVKMTTTDLIVNGWTLRFASAFVEQAIALRSEVEALRDKSPETYRNKNATKRLAAILKLVYEVIPQDPERSEYRQGDTLGSEYKH